MEQNLRSWEPNLVIAQWSGQKDSVWLGKPMGSDRIIPLCLFFMLIGIATVATADRDNKGFSLI
jgi:hypothetical protein